jgi:hypothetical protein
LFEAIRAGDLARVAMLLDGQGSFCQLHHIAAFFLAGLAPARPGRVLAGRGPVMRSREV